MEQLVPEIDGWYTHDRVGPDGATFHIRALLKGTSLTNTVDDGKLSLSTAMETDVKI